MKEKAVVLLSGGIDSSTCLAVAQANNYDVIALSFNYGQRHEYELEYARHYAHSRNIDDHIVVDFNLTNMQGFGGSALTQSDISVPEHRSTDEMSEGIPVTYVPARNTIFLGFAAGLAEVKEASAIFIGVNAVDYSGYPDCRPEYISAYQKMLNLATKSAVEGTNRVTIETPLISMAKADIIQWGIDLGVNYMYTLSCYNPSDTTGPCKRCDSCILRAKGFAEAGYDDPALNFLPF